MAIRKCRLIKQMEDGSHDTIHMETDSTIVQRPDGSSVEAALAALNAKPHLPSGGAASQVLAKKSAMAYDAGWVDPVAVRLITARKIQVNLASGTGDTFDGTRDILPGVSGVLPVGHGGTGVSDLVALKEKLGVTTPGVTSTPAAYPGTIPALGKTLDWCGMTWRVVHRTAHYAVLGMDMLTGDILTQHAASIHDYQIPYEGSYMHWKCIEYADAMSLFGADYIIPLYGGPIFVPGVDMVFNGLEWYKASANNRICYNGANVAIPWYTNTSVLVGTNIANGIDISIIHITASGDRNITNYANAISPSINRRVAYIRPHVAIRL